MARAESRIMARSQASQRKPPAPEEGEYYRARARAAPVTEPGSVSCLVIQRLVERGIQLHEKPSRTREVVFARMYHSSSKKTARWRPRNNRYKRAATGRIGEAVCGESASYLHALAYSVLKAARAVGQWRAH